MDYHSFQKTLRSTRTTRSLTQRQVNERCGFPRRKYAMIERGHVRASEEQVRAIVEVLRIGEETVEQGS